MQAPELLQQLQTQRAEVQTNLELLVKQHLEQSQLALKLDGAIEVLNMIDQPTPIEPEILDGGDVEDEIVDAVVVDIPKPKNARSNSKNT